MLFSKSPNEESEEKNKGGNALENAQNAVKNAQEKLKNLVEEHRKAEAAELPPLVYISGNAPIAKRMREMSEFSREQSIKPLIEAIGEATKNLLEANKNLENIQRKVGEKSEKSREGASNGVLESDRDEQIYDLASPNIESDLEGPIYEKASASVYKSIDNDSDDARNSEGSDWDPNIYAVQKKTRDYFYGGAELASRIYAAPTVSSSIQDGEHLKISPMENIYAEVRSVEEEEPLKDDENGYLIPRINKVSEGDSAFRPNFPCAEIKASAPVGNPMMIDLKKIVKTLERSLVSIAAKGVLGRGTDRGFIERFIKKTQSDDHIGNNEVFMKLKTAPDAKGGFRARVQLEEGENGGIVIRAHGVMKKEPNHPDKGVYVKLSALCVAVAHAESNQGSAINIDCKTPEALQEWMKAINKLENSQRKDIDKKVTIKLNGEPQILQIDEKTKQWEAAVESSVSITPVAAGPKIHTRVKK